jgi:hypothetical protein
MYAKGMAFRISGRNTSLFIVENKEDFLIYLRLI